ncbi:GDSL-like Lipase/Acylhydrolase [Whalleya microplaca]|nr:GDSL-like Lipase/Acylhydrolase [Whalleya microplaca]
MRDRGLLSLLQVLSVTSAAAVTVHLCGDSTMAKGGGGSGSGTEGWGEYLQYSLSADYTVHNAAIGGRSARSFTREGRFTEVAGVVKSGDWVVIEFGHNDGGSLTPTDNGRTDCSGDGDETCTTTYNGVTETVLTYPAYYKNAAQLMLDKGAKVILSSPTPNNVCETGTCSWSESRFDTYASLAASQLGGTAKGVYHVPHGAYAAQVMINLGATTVNANYPKDHTHTGPYMADVMAGAFALGLKCGTSELGSAGIKNTTESLTSASFGPCISYNSSVPI